MWAWLARIIRGRSQHERMRSGVEIGSAAIKGLAKCWPSSICLLNQDVLSVAIRRL